MAPKEVVESLALIISENMVIAKENGKASKLKISVKIFPDKSPAWVDFIVSPEGNKPDTMKTCPGIYKVDGDTLTVCYREPEADVKRPTEFATKKGDGARLLVFRRKKSP